MRTCPLAAAIALAAFLIATGTMLAAETAPAPAQPMSVKLQDAKWAKILPDLGDMSPEMAILRVDPKKSKVYVEGLNIVKRHLRPAQSTDPVKAAGGVVSSEGPIHISNVMLIDPKTKKPTRVGVDRAQGPRTRVARASGSKLD